MIEPPEEALPGSPDKMVSDVAEADGYEAVSDEMIEPLDGTEDITVVERIDPHSPDVDVVPVPAPKALRHVGPTQPGEIVEVDGVMTDVVLGTPIDAEALQPLQAGSRPLLELIEPSEMNPPEPIPKSVVHLQELAEDITEIPSKPVRAVAEIRPPEDDGKREPGEVTPLARIELVRRRKETDPGQRPIPPTAIPSKRHRQALPTPGRYVVGVDLGTATTAMAITVDGRPQLISSRSGTRVIPSVVSIEASGRTFVGEAAARKLPWHPKLGIAGPSRLLGCVAGGPLAAAWTREIACRLAAGDEGEVAAVFGPHKVSVEEIVALLLKEVRASISEALQEPVNRVVLTCPTFFGSRQRHALRVAGELAGFHVDRIVCGPLAVAVQATKGRIRPGRMLVVDCGAGAVDVGLVEITPEGFELVASRGDRALGGEAYDQMLVQHLATATGDLEGAAGVGGFFDIREAAELGKWTLSEQETAQIQVAHEREEGQPWKLSAEIHRREAEALFEPLIARSVELCKQVCEENDWSPDSIDNVVPVGGQARIPLLAQRLREVFKSAITIVDPDTAAPFGAARIAERIAEGRPIKLTELVPHSISVGESKGRLQPLLGRGDPLPARAAFTVYIERTPDLEIFLFEGEGETVTQVEPLTRLSLTKLPPDIMPPFRVRVTLEMSDEGILSFQACEERTSAPVEAVHNGQINPEVIRAFLQLSDGAPDFKEDSVFAWLLKRLAEGERPPDAPRP